MKKIATALPDVFLIDPVVHGDERGWFSETYREDRFRDLGILDRFVQDNHSFSRRDVLRGLHYQIVQPQSKLVRVLQGEVFDVAVDIRRGSPTFGRWAGEVLSGSNRRQMYVPKGFAHGFLVLSETAEFLYKVSEFWNRDGERGIAWNDPGVGIAWPLKGRTPQLNPRDAGYPILAAAPEKDLPVFAL
jgi:dTDP-4-dehydrorhamnose 3,5-epimerase